MKKIILVVDDNTDHAKTLTSILKLKGYETEIAFDGKKALELAEIARPDLILLDIGLPNVDGFEVCRRIRQESWGETLPIIAITGYGSPKDREKSQEAGFTAHFTKPVDLKALFELLDKLD